MTAKVGECSFRIELFELSASSFSVLKSDLGLVEVKKTELLRKKILNFLVQDCFLPLLYSKGEKKTEFPKPWGRGGGGPPFNH